MRRFNRFGGPLGAWLFLALSGCAVYVVPAEGVDSGADDESAPAGTTVPEGAEARAEGAERPDQPRDDGSAARAGAERRRGAGSAGTAVAGADEEQRRVAGRRARAGSRELHVPPGHHPPPGECRIWFEDRPPGRQPAPAPCDELLEDRYPPGVFILYGGESWDGDHDWETVAVEHPRAVPRPVVALSARIGGEPGSASGSVAASSGSSSDPSSATPPARRRRGATSGAAVGAVGPSDSGNEASGRPSDVRGRRENSGRAGASEASPPREVRVPPRHRPPDGRCRVWYEGRPAGRQEPSRPCGELVGRELAGAFILHGDRSFEVDHDWATAEANEAGTVPAALLDVLVGSPDAAPEGIAAEGAREEPDGT